MNMWKVDIIAFKNTAAIKDSFLGYLAEPRIWETILYGSSILSGPALAIGIASIYCLIPYHNVLEEPCYFYEMYLTVLFVYMPFMTWTVHPLYTQYWANFSMKSSNLSYFFLYMVACGTCVTAIAIYYYNWIGLAQPMPWNGFITNSIAFIATVLAALRR